MDGILHYLKQRGLPTLFTAIQSQYRMRIKQEFNLNHFRQIIGLAPSFYRHHWDHKGELVINLPEAASIGSMEPRKTHFRSIIAQAKELPLG